MLFFEKIFYLSGWIARGKRKEYTKANLLRYIVNDLIFRLNPFATPLIRQLAGYNRARINDVYYR